MGLLDYLSKAADSSKRKLRGLLADPMGVLEATANRGIENTQARLNKYTGKPYNPVHDQAYKDAMEEVAFEGMFAGPKAKNADLDALWKAQDMADKKIPRETIWEQTGWFKAPDGNWKFEIPDNAVQWNATPDFLTGKGLTLQHQLMPHADLNYAYSGIGDIPVSRSASKGASYSPTTVNGKLYSEDIRIGEPAVRQVESGYAVNPDVAKNMNLHELQHAVQQREGFGMGGSPEMAFRDPRMWGKNESEGSDVARRMLREKLNEMSTPDTIENYAKNAWGSDVVTPEIQQAYKDYVKTIKQSAGKYEADAQKTVAQEWYKRLAGETEARLTQARMNLTDAERRAIPPWSEGPYGYDVPEANQIVRFGLLGGN